MGPSSVWESCGRRRSGKAHVTVTGRSICDSCNDVLLGATAGAMTSNYEAGATIATAGVFTRISRRKAQEADAKRAELSTHLLRLLR